MREHGERVSILRVLMTFVFVFAALVVAPFLLEDPVPESDGPIVVKSGYQDVELIIHQDMRELCLMHKWRNVDTGEIVFQNSYC